MRSLRFKSDSTVIWLFVLQFACQLALLFPPFAQIRVVFRMCSFGLSIVLLTIVGGQRPVSPGHPSRLFVAPILGILILSTLLAEDSEILAGFASIMFNFSILAPLIWMPKLQIRLAGFKKVVLLYWLFHSVGAGVGLLQVKYPGRFDPTPAINYIEGSMAAESMKIRLASGEKVFRPMGLTDQPGGAANSAFAAMSFGIGLLLTSKGYVAPAFISASIFFSVVCLCMGQVRLLVVLSVIVFVSVLLMLLWRQRIIASFRVASLCLIMAIVGFFVAYDLGRDTVTKRLSTLIAEDPRKVYAMNRGLFLNNVRYNVFAEYPLGAGAGRWGLMNAYFGTKEKLLWAEIMWEGWMYDGGLPLIICYSTAVMVALWVAIRISKSRTSSREVSMWGISLAAYNIGLIATTFSFPVFSSQAGLEFWLFNSMFYAAAKSDRFAPEFDEPYSEDEDDSVERSESEAAVDEPHLIV